MQTHRRRIRGGFALAATALLGVFLLAQPAHGDGGRAILPSPPEERGRISATRIEGEPRPDEERDAKAENAVMADENGNAETWSRGTLAFYGAVAAGAVWLAWRRHRA